MPDNGRIALAGRHEAAGLKVIHRHATRIIGDTGKLREDFPDYFIS